MLDFAKESDLPVLKQIWKAQFGDTDRYINQYFNELYQIIRIPVYRAKNGCPVSMLSMLPVSLRLGEKEYRGHYIYAAATRSGEEGKGYMSRLLEFACTTEQQQGGSFSCLIPGNRALFEFYEKRDYQTVFYRRLKHVPPYKSQTIDHAEKTSLQPLNAADFHRRRLLFVKGLDNVLQQDGLLYPYLYKELVQSGAEALLIRSADICGYAVCEKWETLLTVRETSLTEEQLVRCADALLARYQCESLTAAFPAQCVQGAKIQPYGMLRVLRNIPEFDTIKTAYMGLLMD